MKKILFGFMVSSLLWLLSINPCIAGDDLSFFRTRVKDLLGTTTDYAFPDSVINRFANDGIEWVVNLVGHQADCVIKQDTIFLASGTIQYSLENDCEALRGVQQKRGSRQALDYIPLEDAGKKPTGGLTNTVKYWKAGLKIGFDPPPTSADTVIVFYNSSPKLMVATGACTLQACIDTLDTDLPDDFSEPVIYYAKSKCEERVQNGEWANRDLAYGKQLLDILIDVKKNQPYNVRVMPQIIQR